MDAAKARIRNDAMARAQQPVAEIDVFTCGQLTVEPTHAFKWQPLDGEIAAA